MRTSQDGFYLQPWLGFCCYRDEVPLNPKTELALIAYKCKVMRITLDMTERRNQS